MPETQSQQLRPFALPLQVWTGRVFVQCMMRRRYLWPVMPLHQTLCHSCAATVLLPACCRIPQDMPDACNVPLLGTALPLVVAKSISMELPAVYSWVKFRNLGARVVQGQLQVGFRQLPARWLRCSCVDCDAGLQAYFSRNSRWTPWQHEQQPQMQFMEEYRERLSANLTAGWAPDPVAGHDELLAVCTHRECPYSTLRQVLLDTPTARPRCYRVLVRLMDYSPRDPVAMCHTRTECGLPANSSRSNWLYTLKLLVEDATASLDLILFGPDADGFFPGMLPRDLQADHDAATALQQRFQQLLGQGSQRCAMPIAACGFLLIASC